MANDGDREFGVKIVTSADLTAAQQAKKALEDQAKVLHGAGEAAEESSKKHGLFKDALQGLKHEIPGLARALHLLTNPIGLLTAALGAGAVALANWKAKIEEAGRKQAEIEALNDAITSIERTMAGFQASAQASAEGLAQIGKDSKSAAEGVAKVNAEMERHRQLQDELADKGVALSKARIRAQVKAGKLTPLQGLEAETAIDEQARQGAAQRDITTRTSQLGQLHHALGLTNQALGNIPGADPATLATLKHYADDQQVKAADSQSKFLEFSKTQRDKIAALSAEGAVWGGGKGATTVSRRYGSLGSKGRGLTNAEVTEAIAADQAKAQQELDTRTRMNELAQRNADQFARRYEDAVAKDKNNEAQKRKLLQARGMIGEEIGTKTTELKERKDYYGKALPIDAATGRVTIEGERAGVALQQHQNDLNFARQQDAKVNQAYRNAMGQKDGFHILESLLELQGEMQKETNEKFQKIFERLKQQKGQLEDMRTD